jgi:KDO2-lipid IV(A) lauroyltransferase
LKDAPLRHRLEYAAYRLAGAPLMALPHAAARAAGRPLGDLAWFLDRRHRRVALENLALAYPELPAARRRRLAHACFRHFGRAVTDTLSARRFDLVELCRRTTIEGWDHVLAARRASPSGGFFVMAAHLGLWEHAGHVIGVYGGPLHVIGRPLDNPWLDRELTEARRRYGNHLLAKRGSARRAMRAIAEGEPVGILIDQRVQPQEGIEVPFFGRPARTTPVLARLSLRLAAPVVPIHGFPEPRGRYRVVFEEAILPPAGRGDDEATVRELTARYTAVMEAAIRQRPEQWLWMHRRWR